MAFDFFARLVLYVRDRNENMLPFAFYTNDSGTSFGNSCKNGYTVAVLYVQRIFMNGFSGEEGSELRGEGIPCLIFCPSATSY